MNNKRRFAITHIIEKLRLKMQNNKDIILEIEKILEDEEDAYDSIPENMQDSVRGNKIQDAIIALEMPIECLEENDIETSIEYLFDAKL